MTKHIGIVSVNYTAHEAFRFMEGRSPIPWLHIVEIGGDLAAARGLSKLGILGTKFLRDANLYRDVLSARGIEAVAPDAEQRRRSIRLSLTSWLKARSKVQQKNILAA
jgi:aspartate racemase